MNTSKSVAVLVVSLQLLAACSAAAAAGHQALGVLLSASAVAQDEKPKAATGRQESDKLLLRARR